MKNSEIKRFVKILLPTLSNANWAYKKDMIYILPINDLLKGIIFNKSGLNKTDFQLRYFVQSLFVPLEFENLSFGDILSTPNNHTGWRDFDLLKLNELNNEISPYINKIDIDFFSKFSDAFSFYNYYKEKKKVNFRYYEAVAYSACRANIKGYEKELTGLLDFLQRKENRENKFAIEVYKNTEELLNSSNPQDLLDKWRAGTMKALGLSRTTSLG